MAETADLRSVLHERHRALGARFGAFAGWQMPLEYSGVLAEHAAVRTAVGVFDVSHLGKVRVRGTGAAGYLNTCLTNDLDRIAAGRAQYTLLCDDSGGILDDLIAYRFSDDDLLLVPNAANAATVVRALAVTAPAGIEVRDEHLDHAVLAVQGPTSPDALAALDLPVDLPYLGFAQIASTVVCRTGYTGERGYELIVPASEAEGVWDALLAVGARPCGLGARDTLRTEMGYPLHGQDISPEISPVEAGLGWAVGWTKPAFRGRDALLGQRTAGPQRRLVGLLALDPGVPRPGMAVRATDDAPIGTVTSGTFSPTRRIGIALALLDTSAGVEVGDQVTLAARGRSIRAEVVKPPFVASSPR